MENTLASNEHTPLLENGSTSNDHRRLSRSSATFIRQFSNESTSISYESIPSGNNAPPDLDTTHVNFSDTRNVDQETVEVSVEEVAQALCSAWWRNRKTEVEVTLDFFNEKELYIMHLAWKKVTRGRYCNSERYKIAEAVAAAIIAEMYPMPDFLESDSIDRSFILELHADKDLIAVNLLGNWEKICDGSGFPLRYTRTIFDSDEQTQAVPEFWLRQVDLYDKIHGFIFDSRFQFFLHSLLIFWHICILIVGVKYMECYMSYRLSYLLIILGSVGCVTVLIRLALIHVSSQARRPNKWILEWIGLRFMESSFLIIFVVQAFHLFNTNLASEPDHNQCVEKFYNAALRINYVSMAFVSAYMFVYSIKIYLKHFNASCWIFIPSCFLTPAISPNGAVLDC